MKIGVDRCDWNEIQNLAKIENFPEPGKFLKPEVRVRTKKKHELYHKFDENYEYVALLCFKWIFTELLTEMRKPEVEKKTHY
jgi:hypothetical protein